MLIHHSAFHFRQSGAAGINTDLAQFLIDEAVLEEPVINRAQRAASTTGERLDIVLAKLGLINENDFAQALSRFLGLALAEADDLPPEPLIHAVGGVRPDNSPLYNSRLDGTPRFVATVSANE